MYPILFTIGSFDLRASYIFLFLGILAGILVGQKETQRLGFSSSTFHLYWILVVPLVLLFFVLNGFIFDIEFFDTFKKVEYVLSRSFFSSFGMILGMLFLGYLVAKLRKENIGLLLDLISLTLPLILGIYRIGCLLNGCCYGLETDSVLGMILPDHFGVWLNRYPTQIWLLLFNFALFIWLWSRRKPKSFDGHLALSYLILYSLGRLIIDAFRDLPRVFGVFSLSQLISIAILLIMTYIYIELWLVKRSAAA